MVYNSWLSVVYIVYQNNSKWTSPREYTYYGCNIVGYALSYQLVELAQEEELEVWVAPRAVIKLQELATQS